MTGSNVPEGAGSGVPLTLRWRFVGRKSSSQSSSTLVSLEALEPEKELKDAVL